MNAPTLVAKGQAELAEKIITEAKAHNVHIHQDPVLLSVLSQLDLGQEIPKQLYLAVAKIIAFAYFLQGKHPDYQTHDGEDKHFSTPLLPAPDTIEHSNRQVMDNISQKTKSMSSTHKHKNR